jgi:hypothetical protein
MKMTIGNEKQYIRNEKYAISYLTQYLNNNPSKTCVFFTNLSLSEASQSKKNGPEKETQYKAICQLSKWGQLINGTSVAAKLAQHAQKALEL